MDTTYYGHRVVGHNGEERWEHIYKSKGQVAMCGRLKGEEERIYTLEITVSPDQDNGNPTELDYWGWCDCGGDRFSMIQPFYAALNMCFAGGIDRAEEIGGGKAFRLIIKEVEKPVEEHNMEPSTAPLYVVWKRIAWTDEIVQQTKPVSYEFARDVVAAHDKRETPDTYYHLEAEPKDYDYVPRKRKKINFLFQIKNSLGIKQ